jgi:hypothetical protein
MGLGLTIFTRSLVMCIKWRANITELGGIYYADVILFMTCRYSASASLDAAVTTENRIIRRTLWRGREVHAPAELCHRHSEKHHSSVEGVLQ